MNQGSVVNICMVALEVSVDGTSASLAEPGMRLAMFFTKLRNGQMLAGSVMVTVSLMHWAQASDACAGVHVGLNVSRRLSSSDAAVMYWQALPAV
jgi:hypothetical protein